MASAFRVVFPDRLQSALDYRSGVSASDCPVDVTAAMSKLSFFSAAAAVAPVSRFAGRLDNRRDGAADDNGGGNRFAHLAGSGGWRPTQMTNASSGDDDGFQTYTRRRGGASGGGGGGVDRGSDGRNTGGRYDHRSGGKTGSWGGGGHGKYYGNRAPAPAPAPAAPMGGAGGESPTAIAATAATAGACVAFSSAAVKANVATEERILAKVKGKINKLGPSTYDATKTFMQQILDSDETDFLDDFMKFVFQKAATESAFCPTYARLLHELADEFTHLRDVMRTLFRDYTVIFTEVEPTAPDPSSESYKEFVESQERKKFRRGYSQFVAELVKLGEVDLEAFRTLIFQIVAVIESFQADEGKKQLSEEYIDCLSNMCKSSSPILIAHAWSADILTRLSALVSTPAASLSGFTPKARFALMNLKDYAARGWK